jgi:hypothetical protein
MPSFIFRVDGGPDQVAEADSLAEAKCKAVRYAGQLICDSADRFWDTADFRMDVSDRSGLVLFTLEFLGTDAPAIGRAMR